MIELAACRDCGRGLSVESDEFKEWIELDEEYGPDGPPAVGGFADLYLVCFDCFRVRYGEAELENARRMIRAVQRGEI